MYAANDLEPMGALLVSCLGRGRYLYGETGVETAAFVDALTRKGVGQSQSERGAPLAVAGFFAGGEIGPVGYRSYTHSYTSSLAVFRPRSATRD